MMRFWLNVTYYNISLMHFTIRCMFMGNTDNEKCILYITITIISIIIAIIIKNNTTYES